MDGWSGVKTMTQMQRAMRLLFNELRIKTKKQYNIHKSTWWGYKQLELFCLYVNSNSIKFATLGHMIINN